MTNYPWQRCCCEWDHQYLADGREHQVSSNKHSRTSAQWSFCICDRGGGGGLLLDPPFFQPPCPASLARREMWSITRPLLTSIWSRFQASGRSHSARLFAAGVASMPAAMNQPRLSQQLRGNQIYTLLQRRSPRRLIEACWHGGRRRCLFGRHFIHRNVPRSFRCWRLVEMRE